MQKTENNMETEYAQKIGAGSEGRPFLTPVRAKEAKFMGLSLVPYFTKTRVIRVPPPVGHSLDPLLPCNGFYIQLSGYSPGVV